ncbi:afadin- and alpha-actinin-binding protein B-like isoform X2 [Mytilus californianus]|nr:afadin- and alpha-actinin-binding protein B-like isoform X2 [Mytilus californianus]XP_052075751.1 afadin- and alpha-actinin-binding protein B-like isoform X2 [Mytilus californianus]
MADWSVLRGGDRDFLSFFGSSLNSTRMGDQTIIETFCTTDNIDQSIAYINQELTVLGFQTISYDIQDRVPSLVNRLYEVLRQFQRIGRIREELENRIHRVTGELDHYQAMNMRFKTENEKLDKENGREQEKYRQLVNKQKTLSSKLKAEREEVKRLQSIIKDRDAQFKHELKKKEREINKLKEKLHQLISDKTPNRRVGLDIANSLQNRDGKRSTWKSAGNNKQEEMYQNVIHHYEDKQRELMLENTDLRDCLVQMQKELVTVINGEEIANCSISPNDNNLDDTFSDDDDSSSIYSVKKPPALNDISDGYFQMPYGFMKDNLQKSFRETCKKIKHNMKPKRRLPSPNKGTVNVTPQPSDSKFKGEYDKLQKQISKYKDIIKQQEELIQQSITSQSRSMENSFLHESHLLQEKETLSEQKRCFFQEKANFEKERKHFTEAAIRLGRERQSFEVEKATVLKNEFLQISPFTKSNSVTPHKSEGTRLLPSTPVFSPAPSGKPKTPSTVELYKILGLTPKDLSRREKSTPSDIQDDKVSTTESILTQSCSSAPCDLRSETLSDIHIAPRRTLFRSSSTGDDLDV